MSTITECNLLIAWKNVRMEAIVNLDELYKERQEEEAERLMQLRRDDPKAYHQLVIEISSIKSLSKVLGPKMRCHIPKDFFEKRIHSIDQFDRDGRQTSLEVRVGCDLSTDLMTKQNRQRRSLIFRKHFKTQMDLDYTTLPFIEEDATDLCALIELSTNHPFSKLHTDHIDDSLSEKLPHIKELNEKPQPGVLVSAYVKEHILNLPLLMPNSGRIKELYTACILNDENLGRLFKKKRDILPKDLQDYITDFGTSKELENSSTKVIKDELTDRDQFFHTSINVHANDIIKEIENDSLEFSVFIKPCYILYFSQVMPDYKLIDITDRFKIEQYIKDLIDKLQNDFHNPVSSVRREFMSVCQSANNQSHILPVLLEQLPPCLEAVLRSLFSPHSPVREEACYSLAYLFVQYKLIHEMIHLYTTELVYDIVSVIFKAIDHYPSTFEFYYSLIGYIMDGCPIIVILQSICDKAPLCKNLLMLKRWPKFIVFACKHWPSESFRNGQLALKKITELLEKYFTNKVVYKASRMALAHIGRRFERKSMTCTYFVLNKCGPVKEI